ncbi:unnamed protein product [Prorocentrum cordatum]|uniref:Uncharacterized protein n=1 Tax=Prorocentrum cordatum TaxID=2364126 RepID=A0ABN9YGJ0_9DINO|nr:unnamed protein product [Polarella glacialis]
MPAAAAARAAALCCFAGLCLAKVPVDTCAVQLAARSSFTAASAHGQQALGAEEAAPTLAAWATWALGDLPARGGANGTAAAAAARPAGSGLQALSLLAALVSDPLPALGEENSLERGAGQRATRGPLLPPSCLFPLVAGACFAAGMLAHGFAPAWGSEPLELEPRRLQLAPRRPGARTPGACGASPAAAAAAPPKRATW